MEAVFVYLDRVMHNNTWWEVAIELVMIGLVVYWIVDFLEGTRGERLFWGVLFVLVAGVLMLNLVAERLHLFRIAYLYKGFLFGVLVIAVTAFQPEVRRALIRIGQPRIWGGDSHKVSRAIDEVVTAARDFAAKRTGAIIVFERQVALGEFIETGVRLDARVTDELLRTIFYPGTALHDMAVIVRDDRIVAASVQLPLAEAGILKGDTDDPASETDLGSRHRAALGITAGSDAICMVVSEETGAISMAEDGKLNRNITESQLRARLTTAMSQVKSRNWISRWIRRREGEKA